MGRTSELRGLLPDVPGVRDLHIKYIGGLQFISFHGDTIKLHSSASNEAIIAALAQIDPGLTRKTMATEAASAPSLSRLRDKLKLASGVAGRAVQAIEAEADALIAEEDEIKSETADAFAPHKAIMAEAKVEIKAVKDALNLMSNGGPPLDPLDVVAPSEPGSTTEGG